MPCSSVDFALYRPESNNFCIALNSPRRASCIKSDSIGNGGGVDSRSLSSTLSRPSPTLASDAALLRGVSWTSSLEVVEGFEAGMARLGCCSLLLWSAVQLMTIWGMFCGYNGLVRMLSWRCSCAAGSASISRLAAFVNGVAGGRRVEAEMTTTCRNLPYTNFGSSSDTDIPRLTQTCIISYPEERMCFRYMRI
jgi:hypothetical protein